MNKLSCDSMMVACDMKSCTLSAAKTALNKYHIAAARALHFACVIAPVGKVQNNRKVKLALVS
jgi:hypothetical protein